MNRMFSTVVVVTVFAATLVFGVMAAQATVISLSGGDAADGWVAPTSVAYAYNFDDTESPVIQGVTFTGVSLGSSSNIVSTFTQAYSGFGSPFTTGSSNDIAMGTLLRQVIFVDSRVGTATLTLDNLTANQAYRIDLFVYSPDNRTHNYTLNEVAGDSFTATANNSYVVEQIATASASGKIAVVLTDTGNSSDQPPTLSGIAVSLIPEPSTSVLLGTSLLGLLAYAWRKRKETSSCG